MKKIILILEVKLLVGIGSVYAQPQPGSPWPMMHHDQYHTGRSPYNGPESPTIKWTFDTGDEVATSPAIASDGTIYITSATGYLYAINPDGTEKWRFFLGFFTESSPAIGDDGTIFVGDGSSIFYAVNSNGTEKWSYDTGGSYTWPSPTIGHDGRIYVGTFGTGPFYSLNPDGSAEWIYTVPFAHWNDAPSIGMNGVIYIQADNGYLSAITPSGSLFWDYFIAYSGLQDRPRTSFSVEDSTLYAAGYDDSLYALTHNGNLKWTFATGGPNSAAPAIGEDGTIYFGSYDYTFYALYPDGNLKWSYPTNGIIVSSAAIDSNGTIYFGTWGNDSTTARVYALNPDGSLFWSYGLPMRTISSPAIGSDGTLYIGCTDGKLYAFGTPITTVEEREVRSGVRDQLLQNHPNPFLASGKGTIIRYGLAHSGEVSLKIYDLTGRLVRTLVEGKKKAGMYTIPWDGRDLQGEKVSSGIYFYRFASGDFTTTKKLILLR